jgi:hypothetical protein
MTGKQIEFYASDFYNVNSYLCDENLDPLNEEAGNAVVRNEGDSLVRVCVERNEKCVQNGLFLRHIDAFSFFRDDQRQVAVAPVNLPADNALTEIFCERGSHKCYFETLLAAQFFTSAGTVRGSGAASLQFGSNSSGRSLQEDNDDVSKSRGFRLSFEIFPTLSSNSNEAVTRVTDQDVLYIAAIILGALLMGVFCLCVIFVLFCCRGRKECQPISETSNIQFDDALGSNDWLESNDEETGMFSPPMIEDDLSKEHDGGSGKSTHSSHTASTKLLHSCRSIVSNEATHSNRNIKIESIEEPNNDNEDHFFIEIVDDEDINSRRSPKTKKKKKKKKRKKMEDLKAYVRSEDCWLEERNDTVDMSRKKESKSGKRIFDSLSEERIDTTADIPQLSSSRTGLEVADPTKDLEARKVEKR